MYGSSSWPNYSPLLASLKERNKERQKGMIYMNSDSTWTYAVPTMASRRVRGVDDSKKKKIKEEKMQ